MTTMYLILYHGTYDKKWGYDSLNPTKEIAEAKLAYERMLRPTWTYEVFEVQVPEGEQAHD